MENPSVSNIELSIIIPCRNEEQYIGPCLDSLLAGDYPKDKLEVLIIDGGSTDRTGDILREYIKKFPFIRVLDNPKKITPVALNIGIKNARGSIIMRIDAHASYDKNYITECVKYLKEYNADNVGGVVWAEPIVPTLFAKAIARLYSHPFGVGYSFFRIGVIEPRETDTLFGGCYKREVFDKIGLFNENLVRSQDMEFNIRLKKAGGKILLLPNIVSYYHPRTTFKAFFKHNVLDGQWAILPLRYVKTPFRLRHYVPLVFVVTLLVLSIASFYSWIFLIPLVGILGLYISLMIYFSFKTSLREKDARFMIIMPMAFMTRHFGYGIGEIIGVVRLVANI